MKKIILPFLLCFLFQFLAAQKQNLFEYHSNRPPIVQPAEISLAPPDAIVLFSTGDLSQWQNPDGTPASWTINNNSFTVKPGEPDIFSKQSFGNCQLHVEWKVPENEKHDNLNWGNSGIYLMGLYEVQMYDSYNYQHEIYYNGQAGSIYKQHSPLVNASKPAGEWQSFDIVFTVPVFNADKKLKAPAAITVFHNGVLVQNHVELLGTTLHGKFTEYLFHKEKLPLKLQSHGSKVSFRNIWVREF